MTRGVKTKLTEEQWQKMAELAFNGCQNNTIAGIMDIPVKTIDDNKQIRNYLTKKRQERKNWLLSQNKRIIESNQLGAAASTLIFTEKQSEHMGGLGFTDRPEGSEASRPLVVVIGGTPDQVKQIDAQVSDTKKVKQIEK